jgi:iron complex transport system substrate-binding protein
LTLLNLISGVRTNVLLIAGLLIGFGCVRHADDEPAGNPKQFDTTADLFPHKASPELATHFTVSYHGYYKVVKLLGTNGDHLRTLCLLQHDAPVPEGFSNEQVVRIPLTRVSCVSTTHLPMLEQCGALPTLVGFAAFDYINSQHMKAQITQQGVANLGGGGKVSDEELLALSPQVHFTYLFENPEASGFRKGIQFIPVLEYMEAHPLGAAEWLLFFSLFYNQEAAAMSYLANVSEQYQQLSSQQASQDGKGPLVMAGIPWKDVWPLPSGNSYTATLIKDAGGRYVHADNHASGNLELSMEEVLNACAEADSWVVTTYLGGDHSRASFGNLDHRYTRFRSYQQGNVLACDLNTADFFGRALIEPHVVLKDLVAGFYPEQAKGYQPVYFRRLE